MGPECDTVFRGGMKFSLLTMIRLPYFEVTLIHG